MSSRTITADDLSGKEVLTAHKYTVTITPNDDKSKVKEATAEFDLTDDSAKAIVAWLTDGDTRLMAGLIPRRIKLGTDGDSSETATIRQWARNDPRFKNIIKDKGALPEDVIDAYRKDHPTT